MFAGERIIVAGSSFLFAGGRNIRSGGSFFSSGACFVFCSEKYLTNYEIVTES